MDKFGNGLEYRASRLPTNTDLDLTAFTPQMLLEMCILSGCDYLPSLPGMGIKRAHALIKKLKTYQKVTSLQIILLSPHPLCTYLKLYNSFR